MIMYFVLEREIFTQLFLEAKYDSPFVKESENSMMFG